MTTITRTMLALAITLTLLTSTLHAGTASAKGSCTDGSPTYAKDMATIADTLIDAADRDLSAQEYLEIANDAFDDMAALTPPTAFREFHNEGLYLLHYMALWVTAYDHGDYATAKKYERIIDRGLATFGQDTPICFGSDLTTL